ncbi:unnamed protein product [Closterium sp. Naga37s-1]|nr:unnamed protein product [Closterium sp. Naga37s-1]
MPYCVVPDHHHHSNDQSSAENGGSGATESGGNGGGDDGAGEKVRLFYETYGHGDTKVLMIMGLASGHTAWRFQVKALAGLASGHAAWRFQVKALVGTDVPNGECSGGAQVFPTGSGGVYNQLDLSLSPSLSRFPSLYPSHSGLASGHAAWRYQVNALAGTGVPNGGGQHKESIFESSGLERRDTGEGTGTPKGGRRQEGAEEKGEKGEEGNDEEKERGDEEFGNGECCCNGSRDGKGGGRVEGEGVERGVGDGLAARLLCYGEVRGGEACVFGNRGVGHSSCPSDPTQCTTEVMAADALFLADHLGWTRFHLVGHSMGGMIACKVAAAASHRIISLALISVSGGGFDLLPRLDSRVFSIVYRLLNARTPELRAQVDLDTHFSQEYMEETEAGSGMSRREALHMEYVRELSAPSAMQTPHQEYVRELSAPSAMQTPHGANGHLNACWTHSLTPHDVDEICSAHIPTAVIHGRDDVIAHISLGERVARSLGRVARFLPLMGAHMVLRERAHEVNACLAVLMEVAERRVPVEEWVESYRDDRLPVPATWQNEIGRSSSQDFTNPFFQFPSQWFQPEMWTLFSRTWV